MPAEATQQLYDQRPAHNMASDVVQIAGSDSHCLQVRGSAPVRLNQLQLEPLTGALLLVTGPVCSGTATLNSTIGTSLSPVATCHHQVLDSTRRSDVLFSCESIKVWSC